MTTDDLLGRSLTDLITASSQAKATHVIEQYPRFKLNQADSEALIAVLLQSPAPSATLKTAAKRYEQIFHP